jgi:purine-binding chemotaxis protein CheW
MGFMGRQGEMPLENIGTIRMEHSMSLQEGDKQLMKQDGALSAIRSGKFLTFFLAGEEYGIEILKVHEIIGLLPITRVPQTRKYMRGVINLRGKVIPIFDARLKFGMPAIEGTNETCIIVVHIRGVEVGVIVDRVSEVVDIPEGEIEPAPAFGAGFNTEYILGIGKSQGRVKILLNIDRMLPSNELSQHDDSGATTEKLAS